VDDELARRRAAKRRAERPAGLHWRIRLQWSPRWEIDLNASGTWRIAVLGIPLVVVVVAMCVTALDTIVHWVREDSWKLLAFAVALTVLATGKIIQEIRMFTEPVPYEEDDNHPEAG
jgi:hypothetical protein